MNARTLTALLALTLATVATSPLVADDQRAKHPGPASAAPRVDLNQATESALATLPAVTPAIAKAIIAARPFASVTELDRVRGLSTEQLEQIRARVTVSAPPLPSPLGEPTHEKKPLGMPAAALAERDRTRDSTPLPELNSASEAELAAIPAIGPDLAKVIVAARPFARLDDLNRVQKLGTAQLEQIRASVRVTPPAKSFP